MVEDTYCCGKDQWFLNPHYRVICPSVWAFLSVLFIVRGQLGHEK